MCFDFKREEAVVREHWEFLHMIYAAYMRYLKINKKYRLQ